MAFEKNIPSISLNTDISTYSGGIKSVSDAPVAISMTTKIVLTEQQKQEMLLLGLDPADENQINQYLAMTPEAIAVLKQQQMEQIPDAPSEIQTDVPQTGNNEQISQQVISGVEPHTHTEIAHQTHTQHTHEEHSHDFDIDTSSPEWEAMSNEQKMQTILTAGAKKAYTEEEWAALSDKEKNDAIDKFLNEELALHYPGWKDAKTKEDQLNLLSEFIDENKMSKEFNISFNELLELKVNNPDEYQKIASEYYQTHDKTDLYADTKKAIQIRKTAIEDAYEAALELYCKDNNLNIKTFKNSPEIIEFNQNYAKQHGIETLPETAKAAQYYALLNEANIDRKDVRARYEFINQYIESYGEEFLPNTGKAHKLAIETLVKNNGGSFEDLSDGNIDITELFKDANFIKNKTGHTDWRSKENINNADTILRERLGITKDDTPEDIIKKVLGSDLNADAKIKAIEVFISKGNKNQIIVDEKQIKSHGRSFNAYLISAISRGGSGHNEVIFENLVANQYQEIKKTGGNTEGLNDAVKSAGTNFEQENAARLGLLGARLEDKGMIDAANEGISQREDALEVLKLSNKLFNESETVSEEMKEYYAQSTVEHLQTPEQRAAQAGDLRSYNNESFNRGVATGLANVDSNQASSNIEATVQNNSTEVSQISGTQHSGLVEIVQEVKNALLNPTGEVSQREALEMFADLSPREQMELIESLTSQQISKFPITVCEEFPEFVPKFVQEGKGIEIITKCSPHTADLAIKQMKSSGNEIKSQLYEFIATNPAQFTEITNQIARESLGLDKKQKIEKSFSFKA